MRIALLVVLFVLAAVFVGLTVWGGLKSGSSSNTQPNLDPTQLAGQFGGLRDALARPPALTPQEIEPDAAHSTSNDCVKLQDVLVAPTGATCSFTIMPAKSSIIGVRPSVRKLGLTLTDGLTASIVLQESVHQDNGNNLTVNQSQTIDAAFPPDAIDVYPSGGSLTVECQTAANAAPCRLKLLK